MRALRRLVLLVSIAASSLVAFAVAPLAIGTAFAQGPGGSLPPAGNQHITTLAANYFTCCGDPSQPSFSVDVTDVTTTSNPLVGPSTVVQETDVFVNACTTDFLICGGGCFIPDNASDFSMSSDLQTAVLNTTVTASTRSCQSFPVSLPTPFTINVTWTGTGPLASSNKINTYSCGAYSAEAQTSSSINNATATATTSLFPGSFAASGSDLDSKDQRIHAQGVAQDACSSLGLGGGKGAGPGPIGPGVFDFASQSASINLPSGFLNVFSFTNVSKPRGSTPSTVSETDLQMFTFSPFFVDLCFVLQPGAFTISTGLSTASLHAVIDQNTPACQGFSNGFVSFPLTVDITWTGTGPLASLRTTNTAACGALHSETTNLQTTNPASASGNVSIFTDPIATTEGSLNSGDNNFKLQGVAPQGCIFRG